MGNTAISHHSGVETPSHHSARAQELLFVAVAVVSLCVCLGGFAARQVDLGVGAASVTLLAAGASLASRTTEVRRVRQSQRDRGSTHPGDVF